MDMAITKIAYSLRALLGLALVTALCFNHADAQTFLRVSATDSVRIIRTELVRVPGQAPGLLIDYASPGGLSDTLMLRQRAVEIFFAIKPRLDSLQLTALAVRAAANATDSSAIGFHRRLFGFVIERRSDARWYFLHDSVPVPLPGAATSPSH